MTFIHQANSVLFQFYGCDTATKMELRIQNLLPFIVQLRIVKAQCP